jgi:hypothetical protein
MPPKSDKYKGVKYYAKKYDISVLRPDGKRKSVNELSIDIYNHELKNQPNEGLYPFLKITT